MMDKDIISTEGGNASLAFKNPVCVLSLLKFHSVHAINHSEVICFYCLDVIIQISHHITLKMMIWSRLINHHSGHRNNCRFITFTSGKCFIHLFFFLPWVSPLASHRLLLYLIVESYLHFMQSDCLFISTTGKKKWCDLQVMMCSG